MPDSDGCETEKANAGGAVPCGATTGHPRAGTHPATLPRNGRARAGQDRHTCGRPRGSEAWQDIDEGQMGGGMDEASIAKVHSTQRSDITWRRPCQRGPDPRSSLKTGRRWRNWLLLRQNDAYRPCRIAGRAVRNGGRPAGRKGGREGGERGRCPPPSARSLRGLRNRELTEPFGQTIHPEAHVKRHRARSVHLPAIRRRAMAAPSTKSGVRGRRGDYGGACAGTGAFSGGGSALA